MPYNENLNFKQVLGVIVIFVVVYLNIIVWYAVFSH
jgi:hypothetical protein